MKIKNIGIIGAGTMGSGIAQVASTAGCTVQLFDLDQEALDKAKAGLEKIMSRLVEKGRIDSEEKNRIEGRTLKATTVPKDVASLANLPKTKLAPRYENSVN